MRLLSESGPRSDIPFLDRRVGVWAVRLGAAVVVFGLWELYGQSVNRALFSPPSRVITAFFEVAIQTTVLWSAIGDSLISMSIGFGLAILVGTGAGILMGRIRLLEYVVDPYVSFLYALPTVAILPLIVIWVGIGQPARVLIVFIISVVPVLLNTMAGAKQVSRDLVDVGRNYGGSDGQILRTIVLPAILPFFFAGLRLGIGSALIGMILGEMLLVIRGLGGFVVEYSNRFRPDKVFVGLLAIVGLSLTLRFLVQATRRRLMPWSEV